MQWTHLFRIQYRCSEFQSFPFCVFEGFCSRVLALVMWKVLTSWGFCGCFDDWQNHHWTRANQWHFNSAFLWRSCATQIRNHLLQQSLCWYEMHNYIYIYSSSDHNMSDLANLIRIRGLEWGTIALEVISFVPRVATATHNLRLSSSWDWIQNNARCFLFRGEFFLALTL